MKPLPPLPTRFPREAWVWGVEAGGCWGWGESRLQEAAKCFCSKWGKTLQHKKGEHSVQPALLGERKPAGENLPPSAPPKSVRGSRMAEEEKLEAGGRKERNVRVCQT